MIACPCLFARLLRSCGKWQGVYIAYVVIYLHLYKCYAHAVKCLVAKNEQIFVVVVCFNSY